MARTYFFWDPLSDNILQERDETGAVTAEYTAEPGLHGNIISQNRGGVESQFHYDAQGSTLAVTDDNQQVTDTFAYTAFGEVTERTGTTEVPFQYIGQKGYYTDGLTGQILARRRPFEPSRARWLSRDRLPAANLYWYVDNSPLTGVDPSGDEPKFTDPRHCKGTDCDNMTGIKTYENPKAEKDCKDKCKEPIVDAHEGEHRRNMKACCDLKRKCLELAKVVPEADRMKWIRICELHWAYWKSVNRDSLELRAAVESCKKAQEIVKANCDPACESACCKLAKSQLYLCKGNDPKATIECCPFEKDGAPDIVCFEKLLDLYKQQQKQKTP